MESAIVTFRKGDHSASFLIRIQNDNKLEQYEEKFSLSIANGSSENFSPTIYHQMINITIMDDEGKYYTT